MSEDVQRIPGFCVLCRSRCGCVSVIRDGDLVAVEPDPSHPTGAALCAKGRAAPEITASPDRLLRPLKRSRPKGDPDPGWREISWDEALDTTAESLKRLASESGPESVAFAVTTPSGTGISDSIQWVERLINAFGSPNNIYGTEICNWHKDVATAFTFGAGIGVPDFERTGCLVLWGHNPSTGWLAQAHRSARARRRGTKLIVIDPREAGLAAKADAWLRVRPGTDGALALAIAGTMIAGDLYDRAFIRDWTSGPLLVRGDNGLFLRESDLSRDGRPDRLMAWDEQRGAPVSYDPASASYEIPGPKDSTAALALFGEYLVGRIACRPAFDHYAALCREWTPERAAEVTWVPAKQIRTVARLIWESRPISYHAWSGVGQHTNASQTSRAISLLYALTGSVDAPGGNVHFGKVPVNNANGAELLPDAQRAKALGLGDRPLGPGRDNWITSNDFYRAVLKGEPYRVRGLVGFGRNLLLSHADAMRAAGALEALDFHVQMDMVMTPTARYADIVLPVCGPWEREGLRTGFELGQEAENLVQFRKPAVAPRGQSRSDTWIVFELAKRLGLGKHFWNGDVDEGYRHILAPSGLSLEALRADPAGIRVPIETSYRKYEVDGFATPTRKAEIYSEQLLEVGQDPLPTFVEPAMGPASRKDLVDRYPLVLTSAKTPLYCHSQYRNIPALRRKAPEPVLDIHPQTAEARRITEGDRVALETPAGRMVVRARYRESLDPRVVVGEHGWWQACDELGLPGYDPLSPQGANFNLVIGNEDSDPISGSVPLRSYLCEVSQIVP